SAAPAPAVAAFASAISASSAAKAFHLTGPEHAGRCWNGAATYASIPQCSGKSGSPVLSGPVGRPSTSRRGEAAPPACTRAALVAVIDHVEPAGDLPGNDVGDRAANRRLELGRLGSGLFLLVQHELHHLRGARQAAGMGGEDALCAALHGILFFPRPRRERC